MTAQCAPSAKNKCAPQVSTLRHNTHRHSFLPFPSLPFPSLPFPFLSFPFPFLSFPFLSFPFLSFPFLSFPFLSFPFLLTETHQKQSAAQHVTCVSQSAHVRAQSCLKFQVGSCSAQRGFAPGLPSSSRTIPWAYRRCLPLRTLTSQGGALFFSGPALRGGVEGSLARGGLVRVYGYAVVRTLVIFFIIPLPASPSLVPLVVFSLFGAVRTEMVSKLERLRLHRITLAMIP